MTVCGWFEWFFGPNRTPPNKSRDELTLIFLAELLGTTIMVFIGCLGCTASEGVLNFLRWFPLYHCTSVGLLAIDNYTNVTILTTQAPYPMLDVSPLPAGSFGLGVMIATQIFAHISLAHLNPALSLAAFVLCHINFLYMVLYWAAQILGSILAAGLLYCLASDSQYSTTWCLTGIIGINRYQAFFLEFVMSAILAFAYAAAADAKYLGRYETWPIRIGLIYFGLMLGSSYFTIAAINPVRSFGPAVMHHSWQAHGIFWGGPCAGALCSSLLYRLIHKEKKEDLNTWCLFWDFLKKEGLRIV